MTQAAGKHHSIAATMAAAPAPDGGELEAIAARVQASGTSFYWAMRLLPAARRNAMYAVYAFCREVDDIADNDDAPLAEKRRALAEWRDEIDALYAGRPRKMISRALLGPVREYGLQRRDFLAIVDGMEMDAQEAIQAPSLAVLDLYCARVASAVGLLSVRIFGSYTPAADRVAEELGRALQLTNILRDLAEDAARGRLYLPRELLEAHGIASSDPAAVLAHPNLAAVCRDVAAMAERHYAGAESAMAACPRRAMRPAATMLAVYRAILGKLIERGWTDLDRPVRLPGLQKAVLILRHAIL